MIRQVCSSQIEDIVAELGGHFRDVHWPDDLYEKTKKFFEQVDWRAGDATFIKDVETVLRGVAAINHLIRPDRQSSLASNPPDVPLPPEVFGRDGEIAEYVEVVRAVEPKAIALCGTGGIGKTALATAVLDDRQVKQHFGSRRFFIYCETMSSVDALVSELVQALLNPDPTGKPFIFHEDRNRRWQSLAFRLAQCGPSILCLDGFENIFNADYTAQKFLRTLLKCPPLALMVTMRGPCPPFGHPRWHEMDDLPGLEPDAARSMFEANVRHSVRGADQQSIDELLSKLGGHPLCVRLIANQVTHDRSAKDTLKRYDRLRSRILNDLIVSLELSYDHPERVTRDGQLLLRLLAHLPFGLRKDDVPEVLQKLEAEDDADKLIHAALVTCALEGGSM